MINDFIVYSFNLYQPIYNAYARSYIYNEALGLFY